MMPRLEDHHADVSFNLRWAGITVSAFYAIITIPLLFFPSVFKFATFLLTWSADTPQFSTILVQLQYYFGVFSYTFGLCTLFASIGGFACSTGIDTMRKRIFGRFFLWLPIAMAVFFFFFLKYF